MWGCLTHLRDPDHCIFQEARKVSPPNSFQGIQSNVKRIDKTPSNPSTARDKGKPSWTTILSELKCKSTLHRVCRTTYQEGNRLDTLVCQSSNTAKCCTPTIESTTLHRGVLRHANVLSSGWDLQHASNIHIGFPYQLRLSTRAACTPSLQCGRFTLVVASVYK